MAVVQRSIASNSDSLVRETYHATLGLESLVDETLRPTAPKDALDRAYELRSFEIEHYWKRATYFWGFQIAIFAAFGLLWKAPSPNDWNPVTLGLAALGVLTSLANALCARGSRFWQENWERHIDMLENHVEGRLYKIVWLKNGSASFSVSRINQHLSYQFIGFWILVFLYVASKDLNPTSEEVGPWSYVLAIIALGLFGCGMLVFQWTNLRGTIPNVDGSPGTHVSTGVLPDRYGRKKVEFIRRYAPDEE